MRRKLVILFFLFVLVSCRTRSLPPSGYIRWVRENKALLTERKEIGELFYEAEYTPVDYLVLRDLQDSATITREMFERQKKNREELLYFTLRVGMCRKQGDPMYYRSSGNEEYAMRVKYFSFDMQNDLHLITASDSLNCLLHIFERDYGLSGMLTFNLSFKNTGVPGDMTLIYDDAVYNHGIVKLTFEKKKLRKIPQIKF